MQSITIIGHIGVDATVNTVGESQVIESRVAVNSSYTKGDGTKVENTTWYKIKLWKRNGASTKVAEFLTKGKAVAVVGTPSVNAYTAKDGAAAAEIVITVKELDLLSSGSKDGGSQDGVTTQKVAAGAASDDDNDLPF